MKTTSPYPTLTDVLNEYVAETRRPNPDALRAWVEQYPQFRHELIDFSTAWALEVKLPPVEEIDEDGERRLVNQAMSHVQNMLFHQERAAGDPFGRPAIGSLLGVARPLGLDAKQLADACEIDVPMVVKLDQRKIRGPIPRRLIACLARLLRCTESALLTYLSSSEPRLAGAHLARGRPAATGQQSFAEAVTASSLTDAQKQRWLAEAADPTGES